MARRLTLAAIALLALPALALTANAALVCQSQIASLVLTEAGDGYYRVEASGSHTCVPDANGILILFSDGEYQFYSDCAGALQCTTAIDGLLPTWDCFQLTATHVSDLGVLGGGQTVRRCFG